MIGQFPAPYPDELFYSICARYQQRVKYPSGRKILAELFGSHNATVIHDLPCYLEYFSKSLPRNRVYSAENIIRSLTLLPYYSSFSSKEIIAKTKRQMIKNNGNGLHARLGIMASKILMPRYLRYCPLCISEDIANYNETYWHRTHQLPGVLICPKHHVKLQTSEVKIYSHKNPISFVDANEINLTPRSIFVRENTSTIIYKIAEQSAFLLEKNCPPQNKDALKNRYNYLLIKKKLANYAGSLRVNKIVSEFLNYYSEETLSSFGTQLNQNYQIEDSWIIRLLRKPHTFQHPVYHLMAINFLGIEIQSFFSLPTDLNFFGKSPWLCLNSAATHYREKVITEFKFGNRMRKGKPVGIFKCGCGFEYSRSGPDTKPGDKYRIDKMINFGSTWEAELIRLWNESDQTITAIARHLDVDPLTIRRYGAKLNLSFKRINKNYQDLKINDKLKLKPRMENLVLKFREPTRSKGFKCIGHIDWESRDDELAILVFETAKK
jgi:Tn7-like transposition protein D/TniQ